MNECSLQAFRNCAFRIWRITMLASLILGCHSYYYRLKYPINTFSGGASISFLIKLIHLFKNFTWVIITLIHLHAFLNDQLSQ